MIKPLLVATLAAIVTSIQAHADKGPAGDDPRDNFLYVLEYEEIHPASDSEAIALGYEICSDIASGVMPRTAMAKLDADAPGLNSYQSEIVVDSAVTWLCPEYSLWYINNKN